MAGRNFNPLMTLAAAYTVAQARQVLEPGSIDPNGVITPGIFVQAVVQVANPARKEDLNRANARYPEAL